MVAIVGASGSGKSTLMNILGCLDRPTRGSYRVRGESVSELRPDDLARLRREYFGFIFQRYHLLANLSATGNVELPVGLFRGGQEAAAANARLNCCSAWAWGRARIIAPINCRAVSSSGSVLRGR